MSAEAYNEAVRRLFADPAHAGDLPPGYAVAAAAEASDPGSGFRVAVSAGVEDGVIAAMRFRAFGCPHLIAATEAACQELEGRPAGRLRDLPVPQILERLAVPTGKTGRILLLEDALRALAERLAEGTNGTGN